MEERYRAWIEANHDAEDLLRGRGKCRSLSEKMIVAFPELRLAAGFYYDAFWGEQQHWWCVAPDGAVVDPTANQFPTGGGGSYKEVAEEDRPVGKCMNCGELVYANVEADDGSKRKNVHAPVFCSESCCQETVASLQW